MHRTTYAEVRERALEGGEAPRAGRDRARRPRRDARLEHLAASRGLVRHRGVGAVYHTVNPRLFEDQIVYIVNHAADRVLLLDLTFVPAGGEVRRPAADG
jgi:fatty-acyl-CoA synthase